MDAKVALLARRKSLLASLFPGLTDAVIALGTQFVEWVGKRG
jgi:hypothetical protein